MDSLKKNKLVVFVLLLTFINVGFFVGKDIIINKIADRVIEKLKRYSPYPYGPAFDPDKISPQSFNKMEDKIVDFPQDGKNVSWRENWERERGFSLE